MTWYWKKAASCDLDELVDDLNVQMKGLENEFQAGRPSIMAGYPEDVGAIVNQTSVSHTGTVTETTLKSVDFGRGAISQKGGFRITAAGLCQGSAGAKDIKLKWGGILVATLNVQSGTDKPWIINADFWNVDNTQNQRYNYKAWDGTTLEQLGVGSIDVDTL